MYVHSPVYAKWKLVNVTYFIFMKMITVGPNNKMFQAIKFGIQNFSFSKM